MLQFLFTLKIPLSVVCAIYSLTQSWQKYTHFRLGSKHFRSFEVAMGDLPKMRTKSDAQSQDAYINNNQFHLRSTYGPRYFPAIKPVNITLTVENFQ